MSETKVVGRDGSVTVTGDSYAIFGEIQVGPPVRPEPPRVEDRRLDRKQLRKKFKLSSDAELKELQQLPNFPASSNRIPVGSWVVTAVWSEAAIDKWADGEREMAARISRLLG